MDCKLIEFIGLIVETLHNCVFINQNKRINKINIPF
jgi:hypothetical protein